MAPARNKNHSRRVYVLPDCLTERLTRFQKRMGMASEVDAVRYIIKAGLDHLEDIPELIDRLHDMDAETALREAIGHPKVAEVRLQPMRQIIFTNGDTLEVGDA